MPGMDQAKPSGCRYRSDMTSVAAPPENRMPKTQEASWASVSLPAAPTARVTAMGPEAEKTRPMAPLDT